MKDWVMKLSPFHYSILCGILRKEIDKLKAEGGNTKALEEIHSELEGIFEEHGYKRTY